MRLLFGELVLSVLAGCGSTSAANHPTTTPGASHSSTLSPRPTPTAPQGPPRAVEVGSFSEPVDLLSPPRDSRIYIVEKTGTVRVISNGHLAAQPFLDISNQVSGNTEQGLLSLAFAPDFAASHLVYVDYTDTAGNVEVDEFTTDSTGGTVLAGTQRHIIEIDKPYPNHNGGLVLFDPSGMLLIGIGDGGSGGDPENRAQNLGQLLGKILRIDPQHHPSTSAYAIPSDNPFIGRAGARPEIWAYGLRNPWRFSFEPDGTLTVADVGQDTREEVDIVPPDRQSGANYGWRAFEGDIPYTGERIDTTRLVTPVYTYATHQNGTCGVVGGTVYHGSIVALRNRFVFGDICAGWVRSFDPAAPARTAASIGIQVSGISSFGVDGSGEMYVLSINGPVYRIAPS